MKYALFLGCTIPIRGQNYEISARKVAEALGMEFVDIEEFGCCGFPVKSTDAKATTLLAARNLAFASREGLEICTLCNACTAVLSGAAKKLDNDEKLRNIINEELKEIGLEYKPGVKVRHFSRILFEDFGPEIISKTVKADMSDFSFSIHYGCHYLRPHDMYDGFDNPENPVTVEKLTEATGARVQDYKGKLECCGGAILGVDQDIALRMAGKKLGNVTSNNVDALITICPFCTIMYEDNQKKIEEVLEKEFNLPVLYYPQVLGLAMGIDPKELGFRLNKVKTKDLLQKFEDANPPETSGSNEPVTQEAIQ
ncbi:MAG: CoB--CoM heterodisulfide reductase iron-sulfur subunit B family protein [Thermoplasmata archaeon]|nr:CoB--CoM heterodisulfide reductase iron-sulfur subunit B family protein [Thermoplasmata archaeon]